MSSCAATESGWLVRLESDVNAEPSSVPIKPSDTTTIAPHRASIRPGRRVATSASRRGPNGIVNAACQLLSLGMFGS